ncbi:hypothetical protein CVU83_02745 [Candidatus Falkowbacteria bacterium HGW-Falkowbacteria-2]|uniref:DUF2784 domain-containing protein n=1 Tax=Candidatus Falkowbacteria bacterium HGW-Falkowbacteria-2 TaxID=2013769 RepID=A0A2N2DZ34_9BACT|nr:MAG: hypothetical protein CVU83_02745 [Candidatus Falkowbacteria bacterium HGW-Falkowbacteria-2]
MISKLVLVKTTHTIVWAVMAAATLYIVYCGYMNTLTPLLWFSIGLIMFEGIVLLINKWSCPLTAVAGKYTEDRRDNFDIYLPLYIARYNKIIFTTLFIIGIILVIF